MWNFDMYMLAYKYKSLYLCIVFFMVLDLRLSKDWVVVMTTFLFYLCPISFSHWSSILLQRYVKVSAVQMKNTFFQIACRFIQCSWIYIELLFCMFSVLMINDD